MHSPNVFHRYARGTLLIALLFTITPPTVFADEPAQRFLGRLREEGLYDLGIKYLESSAAKKRLPPEMMEDLPLERILLLQDSLKSAKTPQQLNERMASIEKGLKDFLASSPNHLRRSETQIKLCDLLLDRGKKSFDDSLKEENLANADSLTSKARSAYDEVLVIYAKNLVELKSMLESWAGDKIKGIKIPGKNPKDLLELREQYQSDYRLSEVMTGKTSEFMAQTYPPQSPDATKWLEKAVASFTSVIDKDKTGFKILSLLYRASAQSQLGKVDEARESYTRVIDHDGEETRKWRVQAVAGIIRLDSSIKSGKYELAIQRGEEALKTATARDREAPEWIDLQLALAEARIAWGKTLDEKKEDGKVKNNRRLARELIQAVAKKPGEHQPNAKKLLSGLGIEIAEKVDTKLADTKNWAESIKAARERLERAETADTTALPILQQQLAASDGNNQTIADQVQSLKDDSLRDRNQSAELYQRALRQYRDTDSREELLEVKFLLSYLFLKTERYWESLAIAQELLVSGKGTEKAEKVGSFALAGVGNLVNTVPPDRQLALMPTIERLTKQLQSVSNDSEESQRGVDMLVKLSLIHKRYEDAERYVALGQGKGGAGASILGQILWSEYRTAAIERRKAKVEESADDLKPKQRAEALLRSTWDSLTPDKSNKDIINGIAALANIYLDSDRIDEAILVIDEPSKGIIALTGDGSDLEAEVKLKAYRLKLQALVQAASKGKAPLDQAQVGALVEKMKRLSQGDAKLLGSSLRSLAAELQAKIMSTQSLEEKTKLGSAFGVLSQQLVAVSSDPATLDWAGTSILALASEIAKNPALSSEGKQLMVIAEEAFSKLSSKSVEELAPLDRKPSDFQFKLAVAKSGAGKCEEAHRMFIDAVASTPSNLTVQVEAARNLQRWSNGTDVELLKKALLGTEPNSKKVNAIWGWGEIGKRTSARASDFKDILFEARFNVAKCRRAIALGDNNPEQKKLGLERALSDIRQTVLFYPDLGSPANKADFEKLLRELQLELGKQAIGLQEFKKEIE